MTRPADPASSSAARTELTAWRRAVLAELAGPRGWWSVAGLAWVRDEPENWGSAPACRMALPARCPARVAVLRRAGDGLEVRPWGEARLRLNGDPLTSSAVAPDGSVLRIGDEPDAVEAVVLRRGERLGLRTFDPRLGAERDPRDLTWYDPTPGWLVAAHLRAAPADSRLPIVNLLGDVTEVSLAGYLTFDLAGSRHELLAVATADGLFVHFRDATSGHETYGAGRFLRVAAADTAGRTWVDFHRAVQPPCAHTPHATCPMPPLANRLRVAVRAGERMRRPAGTEPAGRRPGADD